ncbi:MAG TPA: Tm-1-like ATP-binding domain-containing protein, partial [Gemmataceae bacterium]|nr:Tm-1-like ATP-binding domain-containing protein [Gemmataceae bacterium]
MPVLLIGTLDTKGAEIQFVRDQLHSLGALVIDAGVLNPPQFPPDISRDRVFAAAGTSLASIQQAADRGQAIAAAACGVAAIARELHAKGQVQGILALGGSAGTTIGTAAMRALPFGIPKLMVSTLASGQVKQYVGVSDICMMNSVVDISGLNRISRTVLSNAAHAMIGMITARSHT